MAQLLGDAAHLRPYQQRALSALFGRPESLNLRNLAWHGFLGRGPPPPRALWLAGLACAAATVLGGSASSHRRRAGWRFPLVQGQPRLQQMLGGNAEFLAALARGDESLGENGGGEVDGAAAQPLRHPLLRCTRQLPLLQRCIALCLGLEWLLRQVRPPAPGAMRQGPKPLQLTFFFTFLFTALRQGEPLSRAPAHRRIGSPFYHH